MTQDAESFITRFTTWTEARPDIRAALVAGSYGRAAGDAHSDVDILLFCRRADRYADPDRWLPALGTLWASLYAPDDPFPGFPMARSMFCIYAGGLVVDFGVIPLWTIHWWRRALASPLRRLPYLPPGDDAVRIFRDGVRVLFDHDGDLARLRDTLLALPVPAGSPPGLDAFQRNLGDFWYGPADIARHLRRGEVFQAQMLLHRPQKRCLLTMIEWHARCRGGWVQADGLNRTKTLEKWADPRVVEALPALFGGCEADACWRSLLAQMDIFYDLSREVAAHLGYDIPVQDDAIRAWIRTQVPVDEAWA